MISAARLAWLQLRRQRVRLAIAVAGVAFAVILMFMQVGFQDALFRSAVNVHQRLNADLVLLNPNYTILALPSAFPRPRLHQVLAFDGVASVTPLYFGVARWKNPENGRTREIFVIGIDPVADAYDSPEVRTGLHLVRYPDVVLFDELSRPEYGPIAALVKADGSMTAEANNHRLTVRGLFRMGTSFGIDGTIITSDLNFLRIFPQHSLGRVGIGLVRLDHGVDAHRVQSAIAAHLPADVRVLTREEFADQEIDYWARATPIGFVFAFGVIMGLIVGTIIVYQILFADISDHLKEYATLKAMGYTNRYLSGVVAIEATILGLAGFLPGVAVCVQLYRATRNATMLPMTLTVERSVQIVALTLVMCWASGLIAMRKLRAADPADVF